MPYGIRSHKRKGGHSKCYSLVTKTTGKVHSKCTTHAKAEAQERLLNAIEHNPNFKQRARTH
jgi:hypothetical protein